MGLATINLFEKVTFEKSVVEKSPSGSRVSNGNFTPSSSQNRILMRFAIGTGCEPLDSYGSSRCLDQLVNLRLPIVWINILIIPFGCFVFTKFYILFTPWLLLIFISYLRYYGWIRPCRWLLKVYYSLRVLRLLISPLCFSYVLAHLQTTLPIEHIQPAQVLQFRLCACL